MWKWDKLWHEPDVLNRKTNDWLDEDLLYILVTTSGIRPTKDRRHLSSVGRCRCIAACLSANTNWRRKQPPGTIHQFGGFQCRSRCEKPQPNPVTDSIFLPSATAAPVQLPTLPVHLSSTHSSDQRTWPAAAPWPRPHSTTAVRPSVATFNVAPGTVGRSARLHPITAHENNTTCMVCTTGNFRHVSFTRIHYTDCQTGPWLVRRMHSSIGHTVTKTCTTREGRLEINES